MTNQLNIIPAKAMPNEIISPLEAGARGPMDSARISQQMQVQRQMSLIGQSGGRRRRRMTGGGMSAPLILVPPVQAGAVNPIQTAANYKAITELVETQTRQADYDTAKNAGDTAWIKSKVGGSKRKKSRRRPKKYKKNRKTCKRLKRLRR
jgi:hypothetical protein